MRIHASSLALSLILLSACSALKVDTQSPTQQLQGNDNLADCILSASALTAEAASLKLQHLAADTELQNHQVILQKACILGRPEATELEQQQAQLLLDQVQPNAEDANESALLYQFRQSLSLRREIVHLRKLNDQLESKSIELQKKIELLKGLEKELESNRPARENNL
jgi:hypothetical protein